MELSIGKAFTFLVILFCLNVVLAITGMVPESWAEKMNPTNSEVNDITTNYNAGTLDSNIVNTTTIDSNATSTADKPTGIPFIGDLYDFVVSIWYFLRGILFGYAGAIIAMGLPNVLSYLFIGIIAFMQIASIVYVFAWFVSAIRGGGV